MVLVSDRNISPWGIAWLASRKRSRAADRRSWRREAVRAPQIDLGEHVVPQPEGAGQRAACFYRRAQPAHQLEQVVDVIDAGRQQQRGERQQPGDGAKEARRCRHDGDGDQHGHNCNADVTDGSDCSDPFCKIFRHGLSHRCCFLLSGETVATAAHGLHQLSWPEGSRAQRRRRMCTSTVRSSTKTWSPHTGRAAGRGNVPAPGGSSGSAAGGTRSGRG